MGIFKKTIIVLAVAMIVSFILGFRVLGLVFGCYIVGLVSRYLCLTSDIIKDMECVTTCAMVLILVTGKAWLGALFAFSCMWISRYTHEHGKAERISYLIGDSICMATGALLYPYILQLTGNHLLPAMFWFHIWRFGFYFAVTMPIFNKVSYGPDIACGVTGFPIAVTQAFSLLAWFGPTLLASYGVSGYALGEVFGVAPTIVMFW